jgi:hypothetical protein
LPFIEIRPEVLLGHDDVEKYEREDGDKHGCDYAEDDKGDAAQEGREEGEVG